MMQKTLSIIKPDSVKAGHIGEIISRFEKKGLKIVAMKMVKLKEKQAKDFYSVHASRPFYMELVSFMIEGPIVMIVLEGDNAVAVNRELMGATNPSEAALGTIRRDFGSSIERNAVHGSDTPENALKEVEFFLNELASESR